MLVAKDYAGVVLLLILALPGPMFDSLNRYRNFGHGRSLVDKILLIPRARLREPPMSSGVAP